MLLEKQPTLLAKLQRRIARDAAAEAPSNAALALEAAQKVEREVYMHCRSLQECF